MAIPPETYLKGVCNQEHEQAAILRVLEQTEPEMQDELMCWLEDDNPETAGDFLKDLPDNWVSFLQMCCSAGLRSALLVQMRPK